MSINSISAIYHGNTPASSQQTPKKPAVNFNDLLNAAGQSAQVAQAASTQPNSTDTFTTTPTRTV
ncbi:hypothetical protein I5R65_04950 [Herbaspirillum sp. AP02]|uniref:hypothetical protein n=1 Tax=unclassified Herbaspirillum TaxID=2624150 RepID=UPI0015D9BEC8|nr:MULTISPECIES: hypothetical protein [unclassified Herbaspirillum]MBG7618803.1 hypothetical protein [Herbaspirillum sp. AP02]NZD67395.1 hypothetical protein [Herbaspirillum sp. AP21]